jgi:hypothetical protein
MLKALFDAEIKIVQFCRKHTTFTFPTSDWVAQLFKTNMFVSFTPLEASSALKYSVKVSMFVDASYLCSISHTVLLCLFKQFFPLISQKKHLSLPSLSTHVVALLSSI